SISANDFGHTGFGGGTEVALGSFIINFNSINDAPIVTTPATISVNEDVSTPLTGISFSDVDAGNGDVTAIFSTLSGSLSATSGNRVLVSGSGSGSLTLVGTVSDLNAFVAASNLHFITSLNNTANVTLMLSIDDGGNTGADPGISGTGSSESDDTTVTLMVTAVNDAPV